MPRSAAKSNRSLKILGWSVGALVALAGVVYVGGQMWLSSYLKSAAFREKIEERSGITLRGKVSISQPRLEGSQFYTDGFSAQGTMEAPFSKITVEDVRGEYKMPPFLRLLFGERKVTAENIEVQRVAAEFFDKDRLDLTLPARDPGEHNVDVKNINVREMQLKWPEASLTGAAVRINAVEGGWKAEGNTGKLLLPWGLPPFDLTSGRVVYRETDKTMIVQEARAHAAGGEVTATGEINPKSLADLQLVLKDVNVTPLLPEDWRARLHGNMDGDGRLKIPMGGIDNGLFRLNGKVHLKQGMLEALPILHKIADYTKTEQFRHIPIDELSGDFAYDRRDKSLRVTNFVLESRQLIRITGSFTILDEQLNGTFAVGITPSPLKWLPGAQEKVFTTQHDGYAWTSMMLAGTTSAPKEDLSSRLVSAAGEAVVEKVQETATDAAGTVIDTGKKAASGVFDLLFGK